jgi:hypothetical protein
MSLPLIIAVVSRRVNRGDRHAAMKMERDGLSVGWIRQLAQRSLNEMNLLLSIKSMQPTGISLLFIRKVEGLMQYFPVG